MQEHEYRARDKTVKKMSRDGLKEENLHSRKSIRVSNRETDDFFCATQAEDMEDFSKRGERAEDTKSAKKKLYSEKAGRTEAAETVGQDMEKSGKKRAASRKMRIPESESARWQEEIEEADSNTDGLRSCCAYVSPSEAKPGDLIFFQGTYNTPGASHVGIYVGDNMMIHCGNPIQYANISSAYWQEHFMAFGRIQ